MTTLEILLLAATLIALFFLGFWIGGGIALGLCADRGWFDHGLLSAAIECRVKP